MAGPGEYLWAIAVVLVAVAVPCAIVALGWLVWRGIRKLL